MEINKSQHIHIVNIYEIQVHVQMNTFPIPIPLNIKSKSFKTQQYVVGHVQIFIKSITTKL